MKGVITLILTAVLPALPAAGATTYYVAKSGNNSNAGTSTNAAFLTISKAASMMNAGDMCYILSGTYRETVTPAHSGTASAPITFAAYPGAIPIISGADLITNVTWSVYSGSIYQCTTTNVVKQLFCDGVMQNIARWPNAVTNDLLHEPRSSPTSLTATSITDTQLPSGINLTGAYVQIFDDEYGNRGFTAETRQITSWNSSTKTFSYSSDGQWDGYQTGNLYYVYGALSLLDIATEWYQASTTLYFRAPDSASPAVHIIETKNRANAFNLNGLSHITLNGLYIFAASVTMLNSTDCAVDNCDMLYVQHNTSADWTVTIPQANVSSGTGAQWLNTTIQYSSQDGIQLYGTNEVVSNCVIFDVAYYPGTYYACVDANGYQGSAASGTTIVNNTLVNSGDFNVGISSLNNNVCSNILENAMFLLSDGGATYEYTGSGNNNGTRIHHNWVYGSQFAGIYADENQNFLFIYNNVCFSNYIGMLFNPFTNNLIINNTTAYNSSIDMDFRGGGTDVQLINNLWGNNNNTLDYGPSTVTDNGWYPPIGTNWVPQSGSKAIDGAEVYAPYTDGYTGAAPTIGAYQAGGSYWTPGANYTPEPFPLPENSNQPPTITIQPESQTDNAGQTAAFSVTAAGPGTLTYQWQGGSTSSSLTNLVDGGGQYSAVTNATLYITNVVPGNNGYYAVVVANSNGLVTSAIVMLDVIGPTSPSITIQPVSQTNRAGQTATFSVVATGSAPLNYQWVGGDGTGFLADLASGGGQYSAVTNATFYITNLVAANDGYYAVVITNTYGSVTSSVAQLMVITNTSYQSIILADNPTSFWPLDETSGTIIHDFIGTNNGTAENISGLTLGAPGIPAGGTSIYFTNTASAYIEVPYASTLNTPQFTVEVWLDMPTFPVSSAGVNMNPLTFDQFTPNGWAFEISGPNSSSPPMQGWLAEMTDNWDQMGAGTCIQGRWSYYALTYNGTTFSAYTNGVLANSSSASYSQVPSGTYLFMGAYNDAGNNTPDRFYQGGMQNVAVYSSALPASRILTHYMVGEFTSPAIALQQSGTNVILSWNHGFLQEANSVNGPWSYATNAASPFTIGVNNSLEASYFRATLIAPSNQ